MLNYPQTTPQITPQITPQPQLDEASKAVGFDINNYVFGSDSFNLQNKQNNQVQQNGLPSDKPVQVKKRDFKDVLMGVLLLGGIFAIGTSLLNRATGKNLIGDLTKKIGKIFKKPPTP